MTGTSAEWSRRDLLQAAGLVALVAGVPGAVSHFSTMADDDAPSDQQRQLLRQVCQLVLPRTETLGAGDVGTGDFVILALAHGLDGTRAPFAGAALTQGPRPALRSDGSLRYLDWLEAELFRRGKGDFLSKPVSAQQLVLAALDADAFPPGPPAQNPSPWQKVKGLIMTGYYTAMEGGSKELRYELVPGRFDADLPLSPHDRAWSSDWNAVDFG